LENRFAAGQPTALAKLIPFGAVYPPLNNQFALCAKIDTHREFSHAATRFLAERTLLERPCARAVLQSQGDGTKISLNKTQETQMRRSALFKCTIHAWSSHSHLVYHPQWPKKSVLNRDRAEYEKLSDKNLSSSAQPLSLFAPCAPRAPLYSWCS
jgi:hypothetical protein